MLILYNTTLVYEIINTLLKLYCASGYLPGSCIDDYRVGVFNGSNWTGSDYNLIDFGYLYGDGNKITMQQFNNQVFLAGNNTTAGRNNFLKLQ